MIFFSPGEIYSIERHSFDAMVLEERRCFDSVMCKVMSQKSPSPLTYMAARSSIVDRSDYRGVVIGVKVIGEQGIHTPILP